MLGPCLVWRLGFRIDDHIGGKPYGVDVLIPENLATAGETNVTYNSLETRVPPQHRSYAKTLLKKHGIEFDYVRAPNDEPQPFDRGRALEKILAVSTDRALRTTLHRERAKVAAGLARSQAVGGGRWAALCTLARSSQYSWGYREWWLGGAKAAVRAMTPAGILRVARAVAGRGRG